MNGEWNKKNNNPHTKHTWGTDRSFIISTVRKKNKGKDRGEGKVITIKNLKVDYGKFRALDIEGRIEIAEGDRIGIIGSNGAGKTTLINAVLGLVPYSGSIESSVRSSDIAVHLQNNEYISTMSCRSVMEFILGTKIRENKKLKELIDYFEMGKHLNKRYKDLSGGQKQRFTLIMVIYEDKPLTFFDEVTSGLDFESREKLMAKINEWYKDKPSAVCLVTHYYEELDLLAEKILYLDKGKLIDFDYKERLFEKYCGNSLIILDNNAENTRLTSSMEKIKSPGHLIALSCRDKKDEKEISSLLIDHNIDFKRSTGDIEIMTINARDRFLQEEKR